MPSRTELYAHHAKECVQAADRTDNPKYREMLLKMARRWMEEAMSGADASSEGQGSSIGRARA
jgi:hypothetical protein